LPRESKGIGYLRTTRPATPLVYSRGEKFPIGGSKILRRSPQDKVLVVAAGITVFEALKAYDKLVEKGISVRIMDAYSVQPIDRQGLLQEAKGVGGKVVVVEDHYPAGGLGEAWPYRIFLVQGLLKSCWISLAFPLRILSKPYFL